ncbi:hypothetical protein HDR66_03560 [bacterium]|nr:hypothetical protein [bacterium]
MRKFVAAIIAFGAFTTVASADVVERKTCDEMSAAIAELSSRDNDLTDDEAEQLATLRTQHRQNCSKRAGARGARTIANSRAPVKEAVKIKDADDSGAGCASPDANGCCPGETLTDMDGVFYCCESDGEMCFPATVAPVAPVATAVATATPEPATAQKTDAEIAAEIAANIEKGLCGDGTKPNKYGCCGDEKFKDMGNLEFACCPADGGQCYPPIK